MSERSRTTEASATSRVLAAYVAITVGLTFQVSDTDLRSGAFRRLAIQHMLLSYLMGAVIIAITINLVAGLTK